MSHINTLKENACQRHLFMIGYRQRNQTGRRVDRSMGLEAYAV